MTQKQEDVNVLAVLAETPLANLIQIIASGQFAASPEEGVKENETVVGELTLFEKALMTARSNAAEQHNLMVDEMRADGTLHEMADTFNGLLWTSIKIRLGSALAECGGIGIKADYQIVTFPPKEDAGIRLAELLMMGGRRGGLGIQIGRMC